MEDYRWYLRPRGFGRHERLGRSGTRDYRIGLHANSPWASVTRSLSAASQSLNTDDILLMADFLTNIWVQRIGFALGGLVLGLLVEKLIVKRAIPFVSAGLDQGESMTISCNLPRCLSVALLLLTLATSTYVVALEGQSGSPPSHPSRSTWKTSPTRTQ